MTVRVYHSTDSSAPVLSGTAGALITVLDAILVNGYGSKAAVGWTKSYSGTNLAAYRQSVGSNQFYLRVDDTGTTSARVIGYESMSDVNTGTAGFPTEAQFSGGLYHHKSSAASSAARPWFAVSNGKMFYFVSSSDGTNLLVMFAFGDITSYKSADAYHTLILAGSTSATGGANGAATTSALSSSSTGHYMTRSYTQTGSSITIGKHIDSVKTTTGTIGGSGMAYPTLPDSALHMCPIYIHESAISVVRGELPGVLAPLHNKPLTSLDTFSGSGVYAGKTFEAIAVNNGGSTGQLMFEISDTW